MTGCFTSCLQDNPSLLQTTRAAEFTLKLPLICLCPQRQQLLYISLSCCTSPFSYWHSSPAVLLLMFFIASVVHRSDYTYRGGYHYRYQPPGIPPPVVYRPFPLSPLVTYHRPPVPALPYHHRFKGPVAPRTQHIDMGFYSPPVVYQPRQSFKGHFPHKLKGSCPTSLVPTLSSAPVIPLPTIPPAPNPTVQLTVPAATPAQLTTITPEAPPVEISAPVTLLVSTQSGFTTTVNAVETGRTLPARFAWMFL